MNKKMYQNNYTVLPLNFGSKLQQAMAPLLECPKHVSEKVSTELGVMHKAAALNLSNYDKKRSDWVPFPYPWFHAITRVWADDGPLSKGEIWNNEPDFMIAFTGYAANLNSMPYSNSFVFIHDQYLSRPDRSWFSSLVVYEKMKPLEIIDTFEDLPVHVFHAVESLTADYLKWFHNTLDIDRIVTPPIDQDLELIWEPLFL